jgi:hypothetical protein
VSHLVPISKFLRGMSDSPRKKFTLAWLTFFCLACPAALLISLGVPQVIAISAMLVAILPFQYVAYSALYGHSEPKGQALTAPQPIPQTQAAYADARSFTRAFPTQHSAVASLRAVTTTFASLRWASLQRATAASALASLRAAVSLQTDKTALLQATASLQAAATSALASIQAASGSTALQAALASFAESELASLRVQRSMRDELSLATLARATRGEYATLFRALVESTSLSSRLKESMAEMAMVAPSAKSPAAIYEHVERSEEVVRVQRSALIEARPVRRAGQFRARSVPRRRQRSLVAT